MDCSDMYINDLIYYKQIKQHQNIIISNKITNDIGNIDKKNTNDIDKKNTNDIPIKYINLPLKKRPINTTQNKNNGTYYVIDREVYYYE